MPQKLEDELQKLQQLLEGPVPIRAISGIAGLALAVTTLMSMRHVVGVLTDLPGFVLRVYTVLFGLVICVNEIKSGSAEALEKFRQWTFKWFPFLSVMAGKGLFQLFVGSMGFAFHDNFTVAVPAAAVALVGALYLAVHFGKREKVTPAIDRSMNICAASMYEPLYQRSEAPAYGA